ncbi:MAG: hypothetical protein ACOCUT_01930 [bacterium]
MYNPDENIVKNVARNEKKKNPNSKILGFFSYVINFRTEISLILKNPISAMNSMAEERE